MSIKDLFATAKYGVNEIRLRDLLSIRETLNDDPTFRTLFPPIEIGSITLVDQVVLLTLAQIIRPKVMLEVGTYLGYTTSLLAMNTNDTRIITIDLPNNKDIKNLEFNQIAVFHDGIENDNFLRKTQSIQGEKYLDYLTPAQRNRITLIKADSTSLNFKNEFGSAEFVFIDGGHENKIVIEDTRNARSIIENGVLIWHDYGSQIHTDVTEFLQAEKNRKIFHVKGSLCAFEVIGVGGV